MEGAWERVFDILEKLEGEQMEIGNHKRVMEYDGAYRCGECKAKWGALPGYPKMPEECETTAADRSTPDVTEGTSNES